MQPVRSVSRVVRWSGLVLAVLTFVVGPWLVWGQDIEQAVMPWLSGERVPAGFAYVVVALLAADILLPVPSSFVAVAAGVFLGVWQGALVVSVGLTSGCVLGYWLGVKAGRSGAQRIVGEADWALAEKFAHTYGQGVVLALRPVPVLAEASVFFAGATRVAFPRFLLTCLVANVAIGVAYAASGALSADTGHLEGALLAACVLPLVGMVGARWVQSRLK